MYGGTSTQQFEALEPYYQLRVKLVMWQCSGSLVISRATNPLAPDLFKDRGILKPFTANKTIDWDSGIPRYMQSYGYLCSQR